MSPTDPQDPRKIDSRDLLAELKRRGVFADLKHVPSSSLVGELDRRGHGSFDDDFAASIFGQLGIDPCAGESLAADLRFARDELAAGRAASALAMLERVLFPRDPAAMAMEYRLASTVRDPATGRPVNL